MHFYSDTKEKLDVIAALQRDLNIATAFLLLTGQITIIGVFLTPGEFSLSLSGPLFGRTRLQGKFGDYQLTALVDTLDIVIAVLLITDAIRVVSAVVGPGRFSIDVSGPIFGASLYQPTLPLLKEQHQFFKKIVSEQFDIDPRLFKNMERSINNVLN